MTALCALTALAFAGAGPSLDDPHVAAELHGRLGSVAAPFPVPALPEVRSEFQAYSIIACTELTLPPFRFGLRLLARARALSAWCPANGSGRLGSSRLASLERRL